MAEDFVAYARAGGVIELAKYPAAPTASCASPARTHAARSRR